VTFAASVCTASTGLENRAQDINPPRAVKPAARGIESVLRRIRLPSQEADEDLSLSRGVDGLQLLRRLLVEAEVRHG